VPVPDWHRKILAERLASHDENPDEVKTWEEVEQELTHQLRSIK